MTFITLILTIIFIFLIGYSIIHRFSLLKNYDIIEKIAISWGIGFGSIGLQMLIYIMINIQWSRFSILLPWIIFLIFTFKNFSLKIKNNINIKFTKLQFALLAMIIMLFAYTGFESILRPVEAWDSWVFWLLQSKIFYITNTIDLASVQYIQSEYPIIISLLGTFGYIMMGELNDKLILFIFYIFYLTLGILFFEHTRKHLGITNALLFTFLLLSTQNILRHGGRYEAGQADLALAYFMFACIVLLNDFIKNNSNKVFIVLSLMLGFSGLIKNDGMSFVLIVNSILLYKLIQMKKYKQIAFLALSLLIIAVWTVFKNMHGYPESYLLRNGFHFNIDQLYSMIIAYFSEFLNFQNWSLLWVMFFSSVLVNIKKLKFVKIYILIIFLQWLSYFVIFLITPADPVAQIQSSVNRLYIHFAPIALLITGYLLKENFRKIKLKL